MDTKSIGAETKLIFLKVNLAFKFRSNLSSLQISPKWL
ncbi:hypothetical protein UNSW3_1458 [Campylobacter concisus UNSW3]|uniref:Uncharacterized protein n=1 Tax=Campylobacter concisus UNSW3 TaxID=1242966 RepID=U2FZP9_9BACT|nr:hypothetical protein UNSW3_1458 [Campylobacter concisus UNSW3]